jgi:hypothetical protein
LDTVCRVVVLIGGGVDNGTRVIGDRLSFQTMDRVVRITTDRAISVRDTRALSCAIELIAKGVKTVPLGLVSFNSLLGRSKA